MRVAPAPGRHVAAETFSQMIWRHLQRAVDLDVAAFGFVRCGGVVTPGAAVGDEPLDGIDAAVQEFEVIGSQLVGEDGAAKGPYPGLQNQDRKSTRLNSSH